MCGYLLQQAGIACILIDRATFPRDKLCGGGLPPKCWTLLDELIPGFKYEYNSVRKFKIITEKTLSCQFEVGKELRIVQRKVFDNLLLNNYIDAGGCFQQDAFVRYEERNGEIVVTLRSGEQIACTYLIGADGSNSLVRRQLKGCRDKGLLVMEQYVESSPDNTIELELLRNLDGRGYYYRFPNGAFDVVGYGDNSITLDRFRQLLHRMNIPETHIRGCYLYTDNDYPLNDHVILIGDAGGFVNRITFEGIRTGFITARNAAEAVKSGRPFREVNAPVFKKMKKQDVCSRIFFHPVSLWLMEQCCRWPSVLKWFMEKGINP